MKKLPIIAVTIIMLIALTGLWAEIVNSHDSDLPLKNAGSEKISSYPPPPDMMTRVIFLQGIGTSTPTQMFHLVRTFNSYIHDDYLKQVIFFYITESRYEGINHDVAFAQMCHETDFLKFTGIVHPRQFNFAGIGAISEDQPGNCFPDLQTGIRAHIQHLKAYAAASPPVHPIVDPRYHLVTTGSAPVLSDLTGKWATDPMYHIKIEKHLHHLTSIK